MVRARDPVEAAQARARRRRHGARQHGWSTEAAAAQLGDLVVLVQAGAEVSDRDQEGTAARDHDRLVGLLADRAAAYREVLAAVHRTEQDTP